MILIGFDKENHEVFGGRPNLENRPDCNLGPTGPLVGAHPGQKRKKNEQKTEKKRKWKTKKKKRMENGNKSSKSKTERQSTLKAFFYIY